MMNWLYYLLEANLYLAVFYGFYRIFLHKETFYTLNRYYLLASTLIAFILPLLQIGYLYKLIGNGQLDEIQSRTPENIDNIYQFFTMTNSLIALYFIAATAFTIRLTTNLYKIMVLLVKSKKQRAGKVILIEQPDLNSAFSFFNLLFINPSATEQSTIIKHEMVHINQKHSLDIIFFEVVQILAWFNPITYTIKKDIKLLHEYIADDITTKKDIQKHAYAMLLIKHSFGTTNNQLANQIFNQSLLKRRINMLNKKRSPEKARLRLLFVLPLVGGMLCASTMAFTKDYAVDLYSGTKYESVRSTAVQDTSKKKKAVINKQKPSGKSSQSNGNVKLSASKPVTKPAKKRIFRYPPPIVTVDDVKQTPPPPPEEPSTPPTPPKPPVKP